MKKIVQLILLAGISGTLAVHAQTNDTSSDQSTSAANPTPMAPPVANAPIAVTDVKTNPVPVVVAVVAPPAPAGVVTTPTAAPAAAGIPLIQFSDVPLTTAIENLARQAGINYMLDPKIGYGQPDASGQVKPEPTLSIRWENITPENALLALLDNYNLQLTRDHGTGIARITMKDPMALPPLITRVLQLQYASVSNMIQAVQSSLTDKRSKVIADSRTSQLVVVATDSEQEAVDTLLTQLDKPTKQVLIETKLVEISSSPTSKKGVDWTSTLQAQHVAFGNSSTFVVQPTPPTTTVGAGGATVTTPGQAGLVSGVLANPAVIASTVGGFGPEGFLNADGLSAVISFLNSSADAQVISTPRLVTLDNEKAHIAVTEGYPVFNITAGTANTTGGSQVAYTNVGTILDVTPRISANDQIWLKVDPQLSSYAGVQSQTVGGQTYQADLFNFRTFDTQVLVPNAHTLVMGGMVSDNPQSTTTKVPLLGDIPYLGYAFRSETKTTTKDNLLIFITPTIVKNTDFRATETQFLTAQPFKHVVGLNPNSLWDGTKPYNWSNPTNTDPTVPVIDEAATQ